MPLRQTKEVSSTEVIQPTVRSSRIVSLLMILEALRQSTAEAQKAA